MLLSLLILNLLKLIFCLCISDWYLLGVKLSFSHTQIRLVPFRAQLKFPYECPCPFYILENPLGTVITLSLFYPYYNNILFKSCSSHSVPGKAFLVPTFTKHVHRLFPNQASKLLGSLSLKVLQELQQVLRTKPWVFGYKSVLKARYKAFTMQILHLLFYLRFEIF